MRCFSIVSSPNDQHQLQIALQISGKYTRSLAKLTVGSEVFVHGHLVFFFINSLKE